MSLRRLFQAGGLGLVALGVLGCTPDGEGAAPDTTAAPTTTGAADADPPGPVVAEECPPSERPVQVPSLWPDGAIRAIAPTTPTELDLADGIDAPCLSFAATYAEAIDVPTPGLGTVVVLDGTRVRYVPGDPPDDPDHPGAPWWGLDRIRVCTLTPEATRACTNIDVEVLRPDVAALAATADAQSTPILMPPLTRHDTGERGASPSGLARLQDAYGASWALGVLDAAAGPEIPSETSVACEAAGVDPAGLAPRADQILTDHATLVDLTTVELDTTLGREPPEDLAARANAAITDVAAWFDCRIGP